MINNSNVERIKYKTLFEKSRNILLELKGTIKNCSIGELTTIKLFENKKNTN